MLSKGDDYPIHQTPEPIAYVAGQRNFMTAISLTAMTRTVRSFLPSP